MKRDILFDEMTPLSFKTQSRLPPPGFSVVFILEVLTVAFCCLLLPNISDQCNDADLYLWIFVMVFGMNLHLLLTGLENFCTEKYFGFVVAHAGFLIAGLGWIGFGHYLVFVKGIGCFRENIFWASSTLIGVYDLVAVGLMVSYGIYYAKGKNNKN